MQLDIVNAGVSCPNFQNYTDIIKKTRHRLIRNISIAETRVYLKVPDALSETHTVGYHLSKRLAPLVYSMGYIGKFYCE
jgi:hypothetical protein